MVIRIYKSLRAFFKPALLIVKKTKHLFEFEDCFSGSISNMK